MRRTRFFLLDSSRLSSLTLRDYSKFVSGYKQSFSNKNNFLENVWRPHALTATPLVRSLPCRCDYLDPHSVISPRHLGPRSWPSCRFERRHSSRDESDVG